jgi:hypothetical protein
LRAPRQRAHDGPLPRCITSPTSIKCHLGSAHRNDVRFHDAE